MKTALIIPVVRGKKKRHLVRVFEDGIEIPGANVRLDTKIIGNVTSRNLLVSYQDLQTIKSLLYLAYDNLSIE